MYVPVTWRRPTLRATAGEPECSIVTCRTRSAYRFNIVRVSSVEPSSTTTISVAGYVWANTLSSAADNTLARLYVGMTTLTRG